MTSPLALTDMSQTMHNRSTFGFSEHRPFDNTSGSIGTTRSGKYTDVDRLMASLSIGLSGST